MNDEQQAVFDAVTSGRSVIMTGAGGVGKTYLLTRIVEWATESNISYGITATTGAAAILLGGTTLHSFLGIGLGTKPAAELVRDLTRKREYGRILYERLRALTILIIDEVSMLNDQLFDLISDYLSIIRKRPEPFGGVQLVLSGDLFQIPPINGRFFFHADAWKTKGMDNITMRFDLKKSQRHKGDTRFMEILQKLRVGKCTAAALCELQATESNVFEDGIKPSVLYLKNIDVDVLNKHELDKLIDIGALEHVYILKTSRQPAAKSWASSSKVPELTRLCIGAQVMLKWNVDMEAGLCNGARGVVLGFTPSGAVRVKFRGIPEKVIDTIKVEHPDDKDIWFKFMPLRLAWAITINVSQGATLDAAVIDMDIGNASPDFLYGKFYTAISRVRDLKSVMVRNVNPRLFMAHPEALAFTGGGGESLSLEALKI
jgi:ATP-dependent DNA helicase PIF1